MDVPLAGGAGGVPRQAQRGGVGAHPGQRDARAFLQHIAQLACMMHRRRCRAHQHSAAQRSTAQRGSERSGDGGQCVLGRQTRQSIHPLASHPLRSPLSNSACMHAPAPTHMHCLSAPVSVSWPLVPALPAPTQMHSMYWSLPPTEVHTSPAAVPGDATRSAGRKGAGGEGLFEEGWQVCLVGNPTQQLSNRASSTTRAQQQHWPASACAAPALPPALLWPSKRRGPSTASIKASSTTT